MTSVGGEKKRLEGRIVIAQGLSIHQREDEESSQGIEKDPIRTERRAKDEKCGGNISFQEPNKGKTEEELMGKLLQQHQSRRASLIKMGLY